MRLKLIYCIFILILSLSCSKDENHRITESTFKDKTFTVYFESPKGSVIIEFSDSTYQQVNRIRDTYKWNITNYNNSTFLVLKNSTIGIKRINDSTFECVNLSYEGIEFEMTLNKLKWSKEKLYGKWVEDIYYKTTEDFFPPPPAPIPKKCSWPPFYEISENKIVSNHYIINESEYDINNSNEYIFMKLRNHSLGKVLEWKIKKVTDSTLTISRLIDRKYKGYGATNEFSEEIKLIKMYD